MAELLPSKSVAISTLMKNLDLYKYNPASMQKVVLDYLDEVTTGQVNIVDPTNPFVFLLEASAVNSALVINENVINLRKQYASLSQTEEDLYMHMSDDDFLDRFAVPSETTFSFVVQVQDLMNKMVYDTADQCYKITIPRDTVVNVDNMTFTFTYPVDIRKFSNGVVQISYDATIDNPLHQLSTNIIDYTVRVDANQTQWVFFNVLLKQFAINSTSFPLQKSINFSQDINITDQFYYIRAFYQNSGTNQKWIEFKTTHTDQVFDPFVPTAIIKVFSTYINVSIPIIYLTSGLLNGVVRFDVYTTKGKMTVNLSNYKLGSFTTTLTAIDTARDINIFTNAFLSVVYYAYSDKLISGGTNGIDFATLRNRVINNSIGPQSLPITNVQIEANVNNQGFDLVKNVDVLTNRIFLATQKLPTPLNTNLLTSANIGIGTYICSLQDLKTLSANETNSPQVVDNGDRITLLSNNLYISNNGIITLLTNEDRAYINTLFTSPSTAINLINNNQYLYCPFYYLLDSTQDEFKIRIYNLDYPLASNLSFIMQNETLKSAVNTANYNLMPIKNGYRLTIYTKSGTFYQGLDDSQVSAQIAYFSFGENTPAYINANENGKVIPKNTSERIFTFDILTNYDLDSNDNLCITNGKMFNSENIHTWVGLDTVFHIFYNTTSIANTYVPDASDSKIGKFMLPSGTRAITHETVELMFGDNLANLWSRSRPLYNEQSYQLHQSDGPLLYKENEYTRDPITGSIFTFDSNGHVRYNLIHSKGDPVLDSGGNQAFAYRKGDPILDIAGNPLYQPESALKKELDLFFVDGKYLFTTDPVFASYRDEIIAVIDTWVTQELATIQKVLLEQTKIYFYPKTTLANVNIIIENGGTDSIPAEQSFIVDLYVTNIVYTNSAVKTQLANGTIQILDSFIDGMIVNTTDIITALKNFYGDSVKTINLAGLGGLAKNYKIIELASEHNRLCLKKVLKIQQDNSIIISEDVTINFYQVAG